MSPPRAVRYQSFQLTRSRKRKPVKETVVGDWAAMVAGLDALGLDGYALVLGNDRKDLPPEGGFWDAELGSSVVLLYEPQLRGVSVEALVGAVPQPPPTLAENFSTLQKLYAEAAADSLWLDLAAVHD